MDFKRLHALACLLACALATGKAQAQFVPTLTEIRLWEQETNAVIPLERRLYAIRFDAGRSRFVGTEITLGHAAATASFSFPLDCELKAPEGERSYSVRLEVQVVTGAEESRALTSWSRDGDAPWVPGKYQIGRAHV